MLKKGTAIAVVIAFAMTGCATMRENRTACVVAMALTGATLGAVGGGVGVNEIEKEPVDDGEIAAGAAVGLVAGGLIGYLIGHYACPEEEVVAPPPPPPAPRPVPPPPPTERRGG